MSQSEKLFNRAQKHIPGGVNSPVRAFRSVGGSPRFIKRGKGAYVWDEDGRRYLDFVGSWGPLILGHAHPKIIQAVNRQVKLGTTYGASTRSEVELAELIKSAFPSIEKLRLVSSGTEAVMSAVRLARGVTGKKKIIKCDGCYHGHADSLLIQAGSGALTFGVPDSLGVPEELAKLTISIPYNDLEALENVLKKHAREIACFILEPVPANMGVILPSPQPSPRGRGKAAKGEPRHRRGEGGYLNQVRKLCDRYGVILIFDEVITGFRIAFGGAQELFGVKADLTCLGKIVGGGLPIGVFGGRRELMNELAPLGKVYQAGTLSGNPLATAAGIATIKELGRKGFYRELETKSEYFYSLLESEIENLFGCTPSPSPLPLGERVRVRGRDRRTITLNRIGSCFTIFFNNEPVVDFVSAKRSHTKRYARLFHALLKRGIYFAPSQFEANFISLAHAEQDLLRAAKAISRSLSPIFK